MTSQTTAQNPVLLPVSVEQLQSTTHSVWRDAMLLGKPRITVMVMMTVAIGFLLAPLGTSQWLLMLNAMLGVGLVAASSGILNQAWERETDALMPRTRSRPMPNGPHQSSHGIHHRPGVWNNGTGLAGGRRSIR